MLHQPNCLSQRVGCMLTNIMMVLLPIRIDYLEYAIAYVSVSYELGNETIFMYKREQLSFIIRTSAKWLF